MGHTFINIVLSRISPLIVSVACTTEPVFGVLLGVLVGVTDTPGVFTILGGLITIIATVFLFWNNVSFYLGCDDLCHTSARNSRKYISYSNCNTNRYRIKRLFSNQLH